MKITARVTAALLVVGTLLAGCSTPPGPAPANPAPALPADAIAYDDLKSTERKYPFTNSCAQLTREALTAAGASGAKDLPSPGGNPSGCQVAFTADPKLDQIWVESQYPPNPTVPRYFPLAWNATVNGDSFHRRLILADRYYAVEDVQFFGSGPSCMLVVDTGSEAALQFRGILPERYAATFEDLNGYTTNHPGVREFTTANCPGLEKAAIELLKAIDPDGGSLATT